MFLLLLGSAALSLLHALLPNHWLPFILLAQTEEWSLQQTLSSTLIAVIAHLISTITIGITIGWIGLQLPSTLTHILHLGGAVIFVGLGIFFLFFRYHPHPSKRGPQHRKSLLFSLVLAMFFSPCMELEAYYVPAAAYGWTGIVGVSVVYMLLTTITVLALVWLGYRGALRLWQYRTHRLSDMVHRLTGVIFVIFGVLLLVSE